MTTTDASEPRTISADSDEAAEQQASHRYPFQSVERKWQARWAENDVHRAAPASDKPKYYVLDMFPYPSGSGLHIGHCRNYVPGDVLARLKAMQGFNVLHPMGWDAFGQPAEQDAIRRNINPATVVPQLAREYKRQLSVLGIGYDWNREINSTDPRYYKWNQWAFLKLLEHDLAYRKAAPVNYDPVEQVVLSNDEVVDGRGARSGALIEKRDMHQWFFKITAYADKLIAGLDTIDWPEGVKIQQREWIGRSEGANVSFDMFDADGSELVVFTTRPDTLWGATFLVIAPEHPLVETITAPEQRADVLAYKAAAQRTSDMDRTAEGRAKTGVATGAFAENPVTGEPVPIWVADYVLPQYGTGAIMAVPAHDQRDFEFAQQFDLPIRLVYKTDPTQSEDAMTESLPSGGVMVEPRTDVPNLGGGRRCPFVGSPNSKETVARVIRWLEEQGFGEGKVTYRLRDWLISRQRYWGTPIPIIYCPTHGAVPVPYDQLPVLLPDVEQYKPGADGRSPLSLIADFVNTTCPTCGRSAQRETDTMAGAMDSSWYFLRFCSPSDDAAAWNRAETDYWMNVDTYIGGREHAVGHLLYARFFNKFFHDLGLVTHDEPFQSLKNQGMLLSQTAVRKGTDHVIFPEDLADVPPAEVEYAWLKMSKSKRNAVTPDEMAEKYGADALRLYVLFVAPFEDTIQWNEEAMNGTFRFLNRAWDVLMQIAPTYMSDWATRLQTIELDDDERALRRRIHQAVAKVTDDIAEMRFNTVVSEMMKTGDALRRFVGAYGVASPAAHEAADHFVRLLSPLAPHFADELWERLGHTDKFLYKTQWPLADAAVAADEEVTLVVQVNGKLRDRITLPADADEATTEAIARASEKVAAALEGKTIRKVIVLPGKLVNIVVT